MEREGYKGLTGRGARGRREAEKNILFWGRKTDRALLFLLSMQFAAGLVLATDFLGPRSS